MRLCGFVLSGWFCVLLAGAVSGQGDDVPPEPQGCLSNYDCINLACVDGKCVDVCEGACGANMKCTIVETSPSCACTEGFTGDPVLGCTPVDTPVKQFKPFMTPKVSWDQAFKECRSKNMSLATVMSKEENDRMVKEIEKALETVSTNESFYLAGTDQHKEGDWVWKDKNGGTLATFASSYSNWMQKQPDNWRRKEHCLVLRPKFYKFKMAWNDAECNWGRHFVCQLF